MAGIVTRFQIEEEADVRSMSGAGLAVLAQDFAFEATVEGAATRREALQAVLVKVQTELDA